MGSQSLKKNYQFRTVYRRGKSVADKYLVLYVLPNGLGINRLGISVSKKIGNAVTRNRVSRLIRESYRLEVKAGEELQGLPDFQVLNPEAGLDLVFIARKPAGGSTFHVIRKALKNCLELARVAGKFRGGSN